MLPMEVNFADRTCDCLAEFHSFVVFFLFVVAYSFILNNHYTFYHSRARRIYILCTS